MPYEKSMTQTTKTGQVQGRIPCPASAAAVETLGAAVVAALSADLLNARWRAAARPDNPLGGHCAVASEALYHLLGGVRAGYMPVVASFHMTRKGEPVFDATRVRAGWQKGTHWWLKGPAGGVRGAGPVIDLTAAQFKAPFPYARGVHCGFMQPQKIPSRRAQVVMDRVAERLGASYCAAVRVAAIARFERAQAGRKRKALNFS